MGLGALTLVLGELSRFNFRSLFVGVGGDIELNAISQCLLLESLLDLLNDLLLEEFFLALFNEWVLGLLWRSATLVPFVDHLDAEALDRDREIERCTSRYWRVDLCSLLR